MFLINNLGYEGAIPSYPAKSVGCEAQKDQTSKMLVDISHSNALSFFWPSKRVDHNPMADKLLLELTKVCISDLSSVIIPAGPALLCLQSQKAWGTDTIYKEFYYN